MILDCQTVNYLQHWISKLNVRLMKIEYTIHIIFYINMFHMINLINHIQSSFDKEVLKYTFKSWIMCL